jgi:hypothetical protein
LIRRKIVELTDQDSKKRLIWDINDLNEIREARDIFFKYVKQGWIAAVSEDEFKRVLKFSSSYGEIWFIPLAEGG